MAIGSVYELVDYKQETIKLAKKYGGDGYLEPRVQELELEVGQLSSSVLSIELDVSQLSASVLTIAGDVEDLKTGKEDSLGTGEVGEVLTQISVSHNGWVEPHYVPSGGTSGQVLTKATDSNYAYQWANLPSSKMPFIASITEFNTDHGAPFINMTDIKTLKGDTVTSTDIAIGDLIYLPQTGCLYEVEYIFGIAVGLTYASRLTKKKTFETTLSKLWKTQADSGINLNGYGSKGYLCYAFPFIKDLNIANLVGGVYQRLYRDGNQLFVKLYNGRDDSAYTTDLTGTDILKIDYEGDNTFLNISTDGTVLYYFEDETLQTAQFNLTL